MAHLQVGDRVVCSRSVFGATIQLFTKIFGRFGITTIYIDLADTKSWPTIYIDLADTKSWQVAVQPNTKLFYLEMPSNPFKLSLAKSRTNILLRR